MKQSKWIWKSGDFERYHSMLLHNRRTRAGVYFAPMWRIDSPANTVYLYKIAVLEKPEKFIAFANTKDAQVMVNNVRYPMGKELTLSPGRNFIKVYGFKTCGFPAFYCIGDTFASDETWSLGSHGAGDTPAGTSPMYTDITDNPEIFKFEYERLLPVGMEQMEHGTLYDFGKECFGKLILEQLSAECTDFTVILGESREEALCPEHAIVHVAVTPENGCFTSTPVALRYVFVPNIGHHTLALDYEYLPLAIPAEFRSNDEKVNQIWNTASYTLQLNAREGFFDGIKRDRWVWGGDAYQSYFVNYYLFGDLDIVRRTQRMLAPAKPITRHINAIPDYTFYWFIAMHQYLLYTGDLAFIREMYPAMKETMDFVRKHLDADGLYEKHPGDWVFIDWHTYFDKESGPLSAEQMLLAQAYRSMAICAEALNDIEIKETYLSLAKDLTEKINAWLWDEEKGAFLDSHQTGNRIVTRHANIFALLFDLTSEERKQSIIQNVILNDSIPAITTPYFKFFELDAMCRIGETGYMTDMLHSYWGGMLDMGATTFWEEFYPEKSRVENYAMYGRPYDKSLCHAWGASPIYLLGKYALGIRPTADGFASYEAAPNPMCFEAFEGKVPTPNGLISVKLTKDGVTVFSEIEGGTLIWKGQRYPIEKGVSLSLEK